MKWLKKLLAFVAFAMILGVVVNVVKDPGAAKGAINNIWKQGCTNVGVTPFDLLP
jgi:hypothetical protein